jgi:transposase
MRIRKVKNSAGNISVQVGNYSGKRFVLFKHIGSAKTSDELNILLGRAREVITENQIPLFDPVPGNLPQFTDTRKLKPIGYKRVYAFDTLDKFYQQIFTYDNLLFKHLVFMRILNPVSKLRSIELLDEYFGIKYKKSYLHKHILLFDQEKVKSDVVKYAIDNLNLDFTLVFYDVTTLYFETHTSDNFRLNGFSKDNKINQPQVVVGLVVDKNGFPLDFQVFEGNKFEGHTIIPVIKSLKEKHNIKQLTVIADAGMLSKDNLDKLESNNIHYVVGARIKKLNIGEIREIAKALDQVDGSLTRKDDVIYEYSTKRASKDKSDNNKQIKKAEYLLDHPTQVTKRSNFLISTSKNTFSLNQEIIEKHRLLEGIKGYKTNIKNVPDNILVSRYKDLWHVEQSFRIAKSDLQARPIYHRKELAIKSHLLIVFAALAVSKVIEINTGKSIKHFSQEIMQVLDFTLQDTITNQLFIFRSLPH